MLANESQGPGNMQSDFSNHKLRGLELEVSTVIASFDAFEKRPEIRLSPVPLKHAQNGIIDLICPFLPPRIFVKCPSTRKMAGGGGGDRKLTHHPKVL